MTTTKPKKPRAVRAKKEPAEHWSDKYAGLITYEQAKEIADEISRERGYQIDIGSKDDPLGLPEELEAEQKG